jgi:hypothetical protein
MFVAKDYARQIEQSSAACHLRFSAEGSHTPVLEQLQPEGAFHQLI